MLTFPAPGAVQVGLASVLAVPAVARCAQVTVGLIRQMSLDAYRGAQVLPRSRFLQCPDPTPNTARAWFVGQQVQDYLVHGNAVHLITVRGQDGYPLAASWVPASRVSITRDPETSEVAYWVRGRRVSSADVVHVRRGGDEWEPARGVGVVEQHLTTWARIERQGRYESDMLDVSAVPSVAIETPNPDLSQEEADAASERWLEKFQERKPAFLPAGTKITPLAWSPQDSQMVEARKLSLVDVANMFNLDAFWVGGESAGLTYKSVGPMFLSLVRQTVGPITDDFEQIWGAAWLPYGQELRFATREILADDMTTDVAWIEKAIGVGLLTVEQGQQWLGLGGLS